MHFLLCDTHPGFRAMKGSTHYKLFGNTEHLLIVVFGNIVSIHFSGECLVYGFDDLTGALQLSHKLILSSKDYPGILYCTNLLLRMVQMLPSVIHLGSKTSSYPRNI